MEVRASASVSSTTKLRASSRVNLAVCQAILYRSKAPLREKALLMVLGTWADSKAQCYPSIEKIRLRADEHLSERTIQLLLASLVALGEIRIDYNASPLQTNLITILCALPAYAPKARVKKRGEKRQPKTSPEVIQENLDSPKREISHSPSVSPIETSPRERTAAAETKPTAAAVRTVDSSAKTTEAKPAKLAVDSPFIESVRAAVAKAYPEAPVRLLKNIPQFAATLRDREVSPRILEEALALTMVRRRDRGAGDAISSLHYFLPAVQEVLEEQEIRRWAHARGIPTGKAVTDRRGRGYRAPVVDENGQQLDWRGLPLKSYSKWIPDPDGNGGHYERVW